jgi:hypothetical protein
MMAATKTPPRCIQDDELRYYTEDARRGVFYIRSLSDQEVLDAARDETSATHTAIGVHIDPNSWTNPSWVTAQAAQEAWERGIMDDDEFYRLTDD